MSVHDTKDNASRMRFELTVNDQIVFANYRHAGRTLYITHVEAPPALRGKGAASRLMSDVMKIAREQGLKIAPVCSYAALWMDRHAEYRDLVA